MARKILLPDRTNIYSTISFLNDNAGSSSAHVFGRNLFINDALEFDGSFKKKVVRRSQCG